MRRSLWGVALLVGSGLAQAQFSTPSPDWKEAEAPVPPALSTQGLIALEIPRTTLRFAVDPASVSIGPDGVVRYVVVASSNTGAVNALYEGIRCNTAEVRVYARHNPDSGWTPASETDWRPLHQNHPSRHSLSIARNGVCLGNAPNRSVTQILRDLRAPVDNRFNNPGH